MPPAKVFVSHISKEAALAEVLQKNIEKHFLGLIKVFVSSDGASIEAGDDWLRSLREALEGAQAVIVLCSKDSVGRPWVNFEAGAAWLRDVPIIPVCHTDLTPDALPLPLQLLQAVEAGQPSGLKRLYARLAKIIEAPQEPEVDHEQIAESVRRCEETYRQARREGAALDLILKPRILCAASPQFAALCEYQKDLAVIRQAFPDSVVMEEPAMTGQRLREALTEDQFDLIHLICFVDPETGTLVFNDIPDEEPAPPAEGAAEAETPAADEGPLDLVSPDGFARLVEMSGARLAILASCDSMRLGAKMARTTNMVTAYDIVNNDQIIEWERCFYRMLSKGHPLSKAFEVSSATSDAPMSLLLKKDVAFAPPPPAAGRH